MKLFFTGDISELEKGINILSKVYYFEVSEDGLKVNVEKWADNKIQVLKKGDTACIGFCEKNHFFRALGLLLEHTARSGDFEIAEEPQFTTNGVMIDVSQGNSVLKVESIKEILNTMAVMGLNMAMIYTEDNYVVEGEPYFGYMRGRYTTEDWMECDSHAYDLGIEMIPCIQTLAHLIDALKWDCYSDMKDDDDTLLVGEERIYTFIEKLISSVSSAFRTKRIHIGMDEAWKLGQGNYLLKNGYRQKFDIMTEHLERVLQITSRYGLKPMIWSDMYFRAASQTGAYYDLESSIPASVRERVPKGVQMVYWDYYHRNMDFYLEWIRRHREFSSEPIFAGGIWSWNGYAVDYQLTQESTDAALIACKKEKVKEVFATIWGDGGTESNFFENLLGLQMFAEHGYAEHPDIDKIRNRFKFCTDCNFDDFMNISKLDVLPGVAMPEDNSYNPSKFIMWQDILLGLFDKNMEGFSLNEYYGELEKEMNIAADNNGKYGFVFEFLGKVCSVLSVKSELGMELTNAYKNKDMAGLSRMAETVLPLLSLRVEDLRKFHRKIWHDVNLPFGWEILDIRYGGLIARIDSARDRIKDYLDGKVDKLQELKEERLFFSGAPGPVMCMQYSRIPSASRLSYCTGF